MRVGKEQPSILDKLRRGAKKGGEVMPEIAQQEGGQGQDGVQETGGQVQGDVKPEVDVKDGHCQGDVRQRDGGVF